MARASFLKRLEYRVREENTIWAPLIGPIVRLKKALSVTLPELFSSIAWAFRSKEFTNFSYRVNDRNLRDLSEILAQASGRKAVEMEALVRELHDDQEFGAQLDAICRASRWRRVLDTPIHLGRRAGWYALVRHFKPRCVVEIGLEHGFGAVSLCRALQRNEEEGHAGRYLGIDRWEHGAWLLPEDQKVRAKLIRDEAARLPEQLDQKIDFLVYDAWPGFEAEFYELIAPHLAENAIILTDDGNDNDALREFARRRGLSYLFYQEQPERHWFRTGGIGIAFANRAQKAPVATETPGVQSSPGELALEA